MSHKEKLKRMLQRLENSARKVVETRGYTSDVERIRMLEEMIKEQLLNENTRSSTRTSR